MLLKLDLHEKYHGPHGLIAGMTGSGKSEFIITYILNRKAVIVNIIIFHFCPFLVLFFPFFNIDITFRLCYNYGIK